MIYLSLRVTADAEGGLKGPARPRRSLRGLGGVSHQQARAGYIPAHCLPLLITRYPVQYSQRKAGADIQGCILTQSIIT